MCTSSSDPLLATSGPWGQPDPEQSGLMIPTPNVPEGILEVFLMGGLCPWDTFYVVPEHGHPDDPKYARQQWWTYQEGKDSIPEFFEKCGGGERALYEPFAVDQAGMTVNLGPWLYPLRERADILSRMRVFVMQHPFEPHQAATPLALGGMAPTSTFSAMGAHTQRYWRGLEPDRQTPHAYTLYSADTEIAAQFDIHVASASGLHPASARPLVVKLVPDNPLSARLSRAHLGGRVNETDEAVAAYIAQYRQSLRIGGTDLQIAAPIVDQLDIARRAMGFSGELAGLLTPARLAAVSGEECGAQTDLDTTAMGIRLGTQLLTSPEHRARCVTYIDSGLINATGAGYDTHDLHVESSSRNVVHLCKILDANINRPGESDPGKLDLDKHTILLTTEFGRTPTPETGKPAGLNHWPFGYTVVAIGGFVGADQAGVVGAIGPDAMAASGVSTTEFRAAMLMAQGIWPFELESFNVGGIYGATNRVEAAQYLRQVVLGYGG